VRRFATDPLGSKSFGAWLALRVARAALLVALVVPGACRATPDHSQLDAAAARAFVREQSLAVKQLSASVSMAIETEGFDGSLSGALLVEPPARLRLRASKFVQDLFDLVVTPDELDLFWFPDRQFFRRRLLSTSQRLEANGPEAHGPEAFLARLDPRAMRLALAGFELPLAGEPSSLPACDRVMEETFAREGGDFVIRARLAGGDLLVRHFDGVSLFLETVTLEAPDGATLLRAKYDDYSPITEPAPAGELAGDPQPADSPARELWFAGEMVLEDLALGVTFDLELDDVAVNEGIPPSAFTLAPPPGCEVREL